MRSIMATSLSAQKSVFIFPSCMRSCHIRKSVKSTTPSPLWSMRENASFTSCSSFRCGNMLEICGWYMKPLSTRMNERHSAFSKTSPCVPPTLIRYPSLEGIWLMTDRKSSAGALGKANRGTQGKLSFMAHCATFGTTTSKYVFRCLVVSSSKTA